MNDEKYLKLLRDELLPELAAAGEPMVFMQDNAPCHTLVVRRFFADNNIERLEWPAESPNLNQIENFWAIVKHRLQGKFRFPTP
jgi:transposase